MNPDTTKALLDALRDRAWKRDAVRLEQRQNTKNRFVVPNDQLDSWKPFQLAELQVTEALIRWEAAEGIPD